MNDDVIAVLQAAKERVAAGWTQGELGRTRRGGPICEERELPLRAVTVCAEGALWCGLLGDAFEEAWRASRNNVTHDAMKLFEAAIGTWPIHEWNDAPGRTQAEILDAFDRAIRLAKDATA